MAQGSSIDDWITWTSDTEPQPHQERQLPVVLYWKQLSSSQIDTFRSILKDAGELAVLVGDDAKPYTVDWMNKYRGNGTVVLRPKTVEQVSKIMKFCNEENIPVVPQGGNTGLVGIVRTKLHNL